MIHREMRIRWTIPAADNLEGIHEYLKQHHPHLANSTITEIHKAIRSLRKFPIAGAKGLMEGTRELLHERLPHIIAYLREKRFEWNAVSHKTHLSEAGHPRPARI